MFGLFGLCLAGFQRSYTRTSLGFLTAGMVVLKGKYWATRSPADGLRRPLPLSCWLPCGAFSWAAPPKRSPHTASATRPWSRRRNKFSPRQSPRQRSIRTWHRRARWQPRRSQPRPRRRRAAPGRAAGHHRGAGDSRRRIFPADESLRPTGTRQKACRGTRGNCRCREREAARRCLKSFSRSRAV